MASKTATTDIPERQTYASWKDVPSALWPWKNFTPQEIACRGTGRLVVVKSFMDKLERMRDILGKPIIVNSAYRTPDYNLKVGGVPDSEHTKGTAGDLSTLNHNPMAMIRAAVEAGFTGFGHYPKKSFLHVDTGRARKWHGEGDTWFTDTKNEQPTPQFKPEPIPPSITDILKQAEVLAPLAGIISALGLGEILSGFGPVAWAAAALIVGVPLVWFLVARKKPGKELEGK